MTLRVLALDIEGGFGGSSRSLYETVRPMPRADVDLRVWCRRKGPIQDRYAACGIPAEVTPAMPHFSSLPRLSRNIIGLTDFACKWRSSAEFRESLLTAARAVDVVHLNHEGLFLLARWLRRRSPVAITMHIRTHLPSTICSRWQYRTIASHVDGLVFITENERDRVALLAGRPVPGTVIYNVAMPAAGDVRPLQELEETDAFKVAVLSNYAWIRGIDRLIDVAVALRRMSRSDVRFVVAGNNRLSGRLPGTLGRIARRGGTLADYAAANDVSDYFLFLGHVDRPEAVLASCDVLAKPTREANPWGRDILEGLAAGKPVLSIGTYDRFVQQDVTGVLTRDFNAAEWAREVLRLADDRELVRRLGAAGANRVADLCSGPKRADDLLTVWREAALLRVAAP
jgi:glycosyltransferase involved in cell wall biosynthesis